jgi:hypothetical protein
MAGSQPHSGSRSLSNQTAGHGEPSSNAGKGQVTFSTGAGPALSSRKGRMTKSDQTREPGTHSSPSTRSVICLARKNKTKQHQ